MEGFLLRSPRETIRQGFQSGYITNAEDWLQALADRNLTVHIYDDEIIVRVLRRYLRTLLFYPASNSTLISKSEPMNETHWNKYGISATNGKWITDILSQFAEVQESILFGSRAKGNFKPGSDIDLAVKATGF